MKRAHWFLVGLLASLSIGAFAATGSGFPSRPLFQTAAVGGQSPTALPSGNVIVNGLTPQLRLYESDGAADGKLWKFAASTGVLYFMATNDADAVDRVVMSASRTGNAVTSISMGNATDNPSLSVNTISITPTAGTFVATLVGCTTSPTVTFRYMTVGNIVMVRAPPPSATCTSNSVSKSAAAATVPAALRPTANNIRCSQGLTDNGVNINGGLIIATDGSISWTVQPTGSFTASGTWSSAQGTTLESCMYFLN